MDFASTGNLKLSEKAIRKRYAQSKKLLAKKLRKNSYLMSNENLASSYKFEKSPIRVRIYSFNF
jgi:hypothetical protein